MKFSLLSESAGGRRAAAWLGLLLVLPTVGRSSAAGQQSGAPSSSVMLRLRTGAFDPLRAVAAGAPGRREAPSEATRDLYLVQFRGPIRCEWRQALESTGATIIDYIPDFTYLVRAPVSVAARLAALPGCRWHGSAEMLLVAGKGSSAGVAAASRFLGSDVARVAARGASPLLLDVMTLPGVDLQAVARRLPGRVLQRYARRRGFLRVQVAPGDAAKVAATPGVAWVEPYVPPVLFCDVAVGLMRVTAARDDLGLFGRGQVVAVADTGLDVGNMASLSLDFRGRVRRAYALNRTATADWSDLNGHGTHVSGSIMGTGALSGADPVNHLYDGSFAGMAPEANLVFQSIGAASGTLSLPADIGQLLLPPYQNDGARIHSDSWGSSAANVTNQYLLNSWQIDDVCWQARDLVVLFAAGNSGADGDGDGVVDASGLSPQATAKNAITVGASESLRDQATPWGNFPAFPSDPIQGDRMADNAAGMAAFSSRGPTADGRIKPDVVAPGTWILSTRSHAYGAGALWGAYNSDYAYSGGTSMATPLVAGAAAVLREGLQERFGIANPSSALIKASLINGADDLAPGQYGVRATREIPPRPNPVEGWGRVNVQRSLGAAGRALLPVDSTPGVQTEERRKYPITVVAGAGPLRVTIVWTDPPSSLLAGPQLVNDLDLKLLAPDGHWLFGNGGTDRVNNVEEVEIAQPAPGAYTVVIDGYNVPQGPQPFALVVSGPIQPPATTGIQGTVRVAGTTLPLAGADVSVTGSAAMQLTANAQGRVGARMAVGSYTLTPSRSGFTFDPPSRTVTLTDGQTATVDFSGTAAAGALTGVLTGRDGQPLAGVRVTLAPGDQSAVTAADGSYRFPGLPPVVYTISPINGDMTFSPPARRVRVLAGGSARADFTAAAAAVQGTIITAGPVERQSIASAHPVRAAGAQSWTVSRSGAQSIRVHFSRIDVQPTAERIEVLDAAGRLVSRWSGPATDVWSAWATGSSVTVRHTASGLYARYGFDLDGVQTDLGGRALPETLVALQPGDRTTRTNSGSFRFAGLSGSGFTVAPSLSGWEFFPPTAMVTLSPGVQEGSVSFLAQGPASLSGQVVAAGSTQAVRFESLHPYPDRSSKLQEISIPGATRLRLHFARLATEYGADFVRLLGPDGAELKRLSGTRTDSWTDWLPAGHVTVRLDSDDSLNDWGYLIDRVAWDSAAAVPVAGATVALSPGGATAVTDADGSYVIPNLTAGQYTVMLSGAGLEFAPAVQTILVPAGGVTANFEAERLAPPSSPAALAALSPAGQPEVQSFSAGGWSALSDPGAGPFDRLVALQGVNDMPELIALADGHLAHSRYAAGAWTPWTPLPGVDTDRPPVAAAEPDGTLDVLAVGPDGTVLHSRFVNGAWQAPVPADGAPAWEGDRAALVARADGTLELVAVGADRLPRHARFLNGAWKTIGAVGTLTTPLRPALAVGVEAAVADAPLDIVSVGDDGRLLHQRFQAGAWGAPRALRAAGGLLNTGGTADAPGSPPALAAGPDSRLELVVPTAAGLYHARMRAGSWSDAQRIDGVEGESVALAVLPQLDPPAALELFVTAVDGTVIHLRYRDGKWTQPTPLAGLLSAGPPAPASR